MFSPLEQFDAINLKTIFIWFDFSFFNILLPLVLIIVMLLFFMLLFSFSNYLLVPTSFQYFFEVLIVFIFNIIKQQIGSVGYIFFPFIFTLFNFILFSNLLSLIPFGIALTSHIIMMMWLSLGLSLSIFIYG